MTLPTDPKQRKECPIAEGFLKYFPDAVAAVANVSFVGNQQHNPGQPLHWDRNKSTDESDACMRHFMERGGFDTDGRRHTAKAAWRILALLQKEIELDGGRLFDAPPPAKTRKPPPSTVSQVFGGGLR